MQRSFLAGFLAILSLFISACATVPETGTFEIPAGDDTKVIPSNFKIIGYVPSWSTIDLNTLRYHRLTHINWSFVLPNTDGTLGEMPKPENLAVLVTKAHAAGTKVMLSIGGWMPDSPNPRGFVVAGSSDAAADVFAQGALKLVNQYNLDGIDIDWEHPNAGTSSNYDRLMKALAAKLHPAGKLLSAAVISDQNSAISKAAIEAMDFVNIMAYDGGWGAGAATGPNSPETMATSAVSYWKGFRGVPGAKLNLGVPFYGRASNAWSESKTYGELVAANGLAAKKDFSDGFSYNGIPTIQRKTAYAKENIGGIMIWELSQDAPETQSLLNAIYSVVAVSPDAKP